MDTIDLKDIEKVHAMLRSLHDRSLGYAFGGPDKNWCVPSIADQGIVLPIDAGDINGKKAKFTGCNKYATCKLIPEDIRWTTWEDLTEGQHLKLLNLSCYRATRASWDQANNKTQQQPYSYWDINGLSSRKRQNTEAHWIANPFGIRTNVLGAILQKENTDISYFSQHRDINPCQVGGCVTPEMQRDYKKEQSDNQPKFSEDEEEKLNNFTSVKACPFYFRHMDETLSDVKPNPQRYAQCYVTLPEALSFFEKQGMVAAAPIFRTLGENMSDHSSYWYSFYSGFSFIQFPAIQPKEPGWNKIPFSLRWQATTISRQNINQLDKEPPITRLFDSIRTGETLSTYERKNRLFCYSDGYTSIMFLQWIILRRLQAALVLNKPTFDISGVLEWIFEADGSLLNTLTALGHDLDSLFAFKKDSDTGNYLRRSTLEEDLKLLGLIDENAELTERFHFCMDWLNVRFSENIPAYEGRDADLNRKNFSNYFKPLIGGIRYVLGLPDGEALYKLCTMLTMAPFRTEISDSPWRPLTDHDLLPDALALTIQYENNVLMQVCQLLPKVHIIVRAYGTSAVRWMFIPTGSDSENSKDSKAIQSPEIFSGVILLLKDAKGNEPYQNRQQTSEDFILKRLEKLHSFLVSVSGIEEENIRENLIKSRELLDFHKKEAIPMGHFLKHINSELEEVDDDSNQVISLMLNYLERRYRLMAEIKNHYALFERVKIDIVKNVNLATKAVKLFSAKNKSHKAAVEISIMHDSAVMEAWVTPMTGNYNEDQDKKNKIADNDFQLLISDLLFQRISQKDYNISVQIKQQISPTKISTLSIDFLIAQRFSKKLLWNYPEQSIEAWPFGRGFHSTFMRAKNLGAIAMAVRNEFDQTGKLVGLISITLEGGSI